MNKQLTHKELIELKDSPIWEHERLLGAGDQVRSLASEVLKLRREAQADGSLIARWREKVDDLGVENRKFREAAKEVRSKCEQYWNEHNIGDAEIHAVLEFIHSALTQPKEDTKESWWCCRAYYGKHEPSCKNYKE